MYNPKVAFVGFEGRAEISEGNFSLLLKNLQEGDSGCYTAVVSGVKETNVATYMLVVQERVESPVLTVESVCSTNVTCNATVSCRGQNTAVTSICNNSTCSQVGGESRGAETSSVPLLSVYVAGGSIILSPPAGMSVCMSKIILLSVGLAIMISAVITVHIRDRFHNG
ncbi:unnamed protein product [Coregonus sp. 'balchen']|nr:unnamed protein product [Coregonus sp. 'balchen']